METEWLRLLTVDQKVTIIVHGYVKFQFMKNPQIEAAVTAYGPGLTAFAINGPAPAVQYFTVATTTVTPNYDLVTITTSRGQTFELMQGDECEFYFTGELNVTLTTNGTGLPVRIAVHKVLPRD
jgi:hypothetical protein